MIFGIGCDIIEIERIANADKRFLDKHFTENERKMFFEKKYASNTIAANFAAKEAFSKALGTGVRGFSLNEIEILRDELGKPYMNAYGKAKEILENLVIENIFVSLSHSKELAMGYVVLERK